MFFLYRVQLSRSVENLRSWDHSLTSPEGEMTEDCAPQREIKALSEILLPWVEQVFRNENYLVRIVYDENAHSEVLDKLMELEQSHDRVFVESNLAEGNPSERIIESHLDETVVAIINATPYTLMLPEVVEELRHIEPESKRRTQVCFDWLLKGNLSAGVIRQIRLSKKPTSETNVVTIRNMSERDPRVGSYRRLGSASYYYPVCHISNKPGFLKFSTDHEIATRTDWTVLPEVIESSVSRNLGTLFSNEEKTVLSEEDVTVEDRVRFKVEITGPFQIALDLVLGEGAISKGALVAFQLEDFSGQPLASNVEVGGLARSASDSIGYFFYLLYSRPGNNKLKQTVELPEGVKCVGIGIQRWQGSKHEILLKRIEIIQK